MKIEKTGRLRNAGTTGLAEGTPKLYREGLETIRGMIFRVPGQDQGNQYNYRVTITTDELLDALNLELSVTCRSKESKAIYEGALATLRALLE